MRLVNRVGIVTGAATGIGKAIATCLAREGAAVAVNYVSGQVDVAEAFVAELKRNGCQAIAVQADVSDPMDVEDLIGRTVSAFGRLDIMVNNAGIEHKSAFIDVPLELWQKTLAVNLTGPFLCMQSAARQMIKQGNGGRIINISSVHEDLPMPTNAPYCASKGGLRMLMRTACVELAPHRITVNNIGPGAIDTPMDAPLKEHPDQMERLLSVIPLHRMGQPEEIGQCAVFLASDDAAYATGATFFVDGGMLRFATSL
ncbi:MAG: SDR family oxidoreductase [Ktedonobacteraceae bacterium]